MNSLVIVSFSSSPILITSSCVFGSSCLLFCVVVFVVVFESVFVAFGFSVFLFAFGYLKFTFTVPCFIFAILFTVKITFVPSSTTSPTSMLCFKTVPSALDVSSSYTTSAVSFAS